jgi:hypothetical protein
MLPELHMSMFFSFPLLTLSGFKSSEEGSTDRNGLSIRSPKNTHCYVTDLHLLSQIERNKTIVDLEPHLHTNLENGGLDIYVRNFWPP